MRIFASILLFLLSYSQKENIKKLKMHEIKKKAIINFQDGLKMLLLKIFV